MQRKLILVFLSAGILAATLVRAQRPSANPVPAVPGLPPAARAAAAAIDPEKIRAHVRFLSLDLLEGRGPGTVSYTHLDVYKRQHGSSHRQHRAW